MAFLSGQTMARGAKEGAPPLLLAVDVLSSAVSTLETALDSAPVAVVHAVLATVWQAVQGARELSARPRGCGPPEAPVPCAFHQRGACFFGAAGWNLHEASHSEDGAQNNDQSDGGAVPVLDLSSGLNAAGCQDQPEGRAGRCSSSTSVLARASAKG